MTYLPPSAITDGAHVRPNDDHAGRAARASPRYTQCCRSGDVITWIFTPAEPVANASYAAPTRITNGSGKSPAYAGGACSAAAGGATSTATARTATAATATDRGRHSIR